MKTTIGDLGDLTGKRVLVRVDFNVPMDKTTGEITNDRRIRAALPTVKALLDKGAAVVAMSHVGRPTGDPAKDANLKMDRIAERFGELLGRHVKKVGDILLPFGNVAMAKQLAKHETGVAWAARPAVHAMQPGDVVMLENLRFDPREQRFDITFKMDPNRVYGGDEFLASSAQDFAGELAQLGDAYVNDAFGTCHNDKDTSMVGVPAVMKARGKPRAVGLLVAKELEVIDALMANPKRPFVAVMGGAKVSDKLNFIKALLTKVDRLLVGGKMANAFLKARGVDVGASPVADEEVNAARPLLPHVGSKIVLPVDALCAKADDLTQTQVCEGPIAAGYSAVDIGPKTTAEYAVVIKEAGTVIWNGPVGWFEQPAFAAGTQGIAKAMAESDAVTVVGGGETAEAVEQFGLDGDMTHVSTGGGAFLAYVEGKKFASLAQIDDR